MVFLFSHLYRICLFRGVSREECRRMFIYYFIPSNSINKVLYEYSEELENVRTLLGLESIIPNSLVRIFIRFSFSPRINRYIKVPRIRVRTKISKLIRETSDNVIVVVNAHMFYWLDKIKFFDLLDNEKIKIVVFFSDKIKLFIETYGFDIRDLEKKTDLLMTYNEMDSQKYKIPLAAPIIYDYTFDGCSEYLCVRRDIDVFFIGSGKGRENIINDVYLKCTSRGLKCEFYVLNARSNNGCAGIHYLSSALGYHEVLGIAHRAKAILNILQPGSSGVTVRDSEAYSFGSFVITNNRCEKLLEIYNSGQIINIENDKWENELERIVYSDARFPKKKNAYSRKQYFDTIIDELNRRQKR